VEDSGGPFEHADGLGRHGFKGSGVALAHLLEEEVELAVPHLGVIGGSQAPTGSFVRSRVRHWLRSASWETATEIPLPLSSSRNTT
jgi:hypothetical protein